MPADLASDPQERDPEELAALLHRLRHDPRVQVRVHVAELAAEHCGKLSLAAVNELLAALCHDSSARVRASAGRGLAQLIERASPGDRIELISAWTTSPDPRRRAAIARALCTPTPMFVTDLAIEQLAADTSAEVRAAALDAAAVHFAEAPAVYAAIAQARSEDADPEVRYAARRLLMRR